jgi:hypothetical protein
VSGDIVKVFKSLEGASAVIGAGVAGVGTTLAIKFEEALGKQLLNLQTLTATVSTGTFNITAIEALQAKIEEEKEKVKPTGDGFRTPIGDSLKTPQGTFDIYEKDYMLIATKLPEVLQKSSETGMKNVLKDKMTDINNIISGALSNININGNKGNDQSQKQEVVHTVNFKVSVDGPKNKLTDMLVEELPKNPSLMQYIVKHFDNTKTSGGMIVKK